MLVVTNGRSAVDALQRAGIPGDKLPWDDVLHDGPLPAGPDLDGLSVVRARYLADCGWGEFDAVLAMLRERNERLARSREDDEVVLWFEHDLYDQLQLMQVLDWFGPPARRPGRLSLVCHARFVSELPDGQLHADFSARAPVTDAQLGLALDAWAAVRAPTPDAVIALLNGDTDALPFLRPALLRLLEELPGRDGLARSERQALAAVAEGAVTVAEAFRWVQALEEPRYLGDASLQLYLRRLTQGPAPLLTEADGTYALTEVGRAVLEDREDRIRVNGIHRWWGGVRLAAESLWRWDADRQRLRRPALLEEDSPSA